MPDLDSSCFLVSNFLNIITFSITLTIILLFYLIIIIIIPNLDYYYGALGQFIKTTSPLRGGYSGKYTPLSRPAGKEKKHKYIGNKRIKTRKRIRLTREKITINFIYLKGNEFNMFKRERK